jgi:hypothetical protein
MGTIALTGVGLVAACAIGGCGADVTQTVTSLAPPVKITVTRPLLPSDITGDAVTVTGVVDPAGATVDVAGRRATVVHGEFRARADVASQGKTTIAVVASASGSSPGGVAIVITRVRPPRQTASALAATGSVASGNGALGAPAVAIPCGPGVSIVNSVQCSYATSVQTAYTENGPGTYPVYNPVTGSHGSVTCMNVSAAAALCANFVGTFVYLTR